jgi:hypothetical protein
MSWNSITFGLLAQDRIARYLKEAADDQRAAAAVARRPPARALPGAVARMGLLGMAVRALTPKRSERGSRSDTLDGDAC